MSEAPMIRIHYIEDNPIDQCALTRAVQKQVLPYLIDFSSSLTEARARGYAYDLFICDFFLSDGTILDLLPAMSNQAPVIVVTGQADLNNAVTALKLGAKDYLVKDPEGNYLNLLPIQIDNLIRQQQMERDKRRLSSLLISVGDSIPFGVYLYEPGTNKVVYANRAFLSIWDFPDKKDNERGLTHEFVSNYILSMIEQGKDEFFIFSRGEPDQLVRPYVGEVRVQGSKTISYFSDRIPFEMGSPACRVGIFQDTTELNTAREAVCEYSCELESLNLTLDLRVQERTQQLEDLMKKQCDLIEHIGHDLRTPLTPLVGLLPFLLQSETDFEKKKDLEILCESTMKMRTLVEEILMMGNLGGEKAPYSQYDIIPCDLSAMVDEVIKESLSHINSKKLCVKNSILPGIQIKIKRIHLHLILEKLIHNALQFTSPGGTITLNGRKDRQCSWFCVTDTGIGLTSDDASRIFDDFYKADTSRNDLQSHGLGLSVVKKLVLLNHGHITVKSDGPGMGSRFCVSLPDCGKQKSPARWDCIRTKN
jgi:signal transduction histidine kinase/ActR/RegA family two-component response regulator